MRDSQLTSDVLMIRPARFCANPQTKESNRFQRDNGQSGDARDAAAREFESLAGALRHAGIGVHIVDDTPQPHTPDALFPNNWVSFHSDGTVVLYPMMAPNRRQERRMDVLEAVEKAHGFRIRNIVDLTAHEANSEFLEGTGSLVLDRENRVAYACQSPRTNLQVIGEFSQQLDYEVVAFDAFDATGTQIYHTNVMMSVGRRFAVVCSESIRSDQRAAVIATLKTSGREVIEITFDQMNAFAGNILELATDGGGSIVALSDAARSAFTQQQRDHLASLAGPLVSASIPTIEALGGGSVRCMLAEIFLPKQPTV